MFHAPHGYQRAPLPRTRETEPDATAPQTTTSAPVTADRKAAEPPSAQSTRRDAYFDNAKFLAIVLVAMAHAWEPLMDGSRATRALYMLVYTFHMPAFILISGYMSRSYAGKPHQLKRLLTGIAVPYVVFEIAYSLFDRYGNDDPDQPITLLDPYYLTWFLAALFVWRLTTPLWKVIRWPVPVALAIAGLVSITPGVGSDLNLQRVLQFLPFFVLGLLLKPEHFQLVRRREVRLLAVPMFAVAVVVAYWAAPRMNVKWFYHTDSVQELGVPWWTGGVMTFALFGCAVVATIGFLAWVPGRRTWFTVLGTGTICGYLLHGFLLRAAQYAGVYEENPWLNTPGGQILVTLVAAVAVTLLCTPPVRKLFRGVTEPEMKWAFKRDVSELGPRR